MVGNKKVSVFDVVVWIITGFLSILFVLPLLYIVSNAISNPQAVFNGEVGLLPKGITFQNFIEVFKDELLVTGLKNTIWYTITGTIIQVVLQFSVAYPLSRKDLRGKTFVNIFFVIPMFVSGGMIPTYMVIKAIGMLNTPWAIVIPGCLGLYNIIIIRTYLQTSIPYDLTEASMVDGCGVLRNFITIILPLCKPILCVMILYGIVGYWNTYFNSLIYTARDYLWPLQRVLQKLIISGSSSIDYASLVKAEGIKYAVILVSSIPLLALYPFFQKYFEKGIMIGGVKG